MLGKYGFYVNYEMKDAEFKYGFKQQGVFALEDIKKGQPVFACDPIVCTYLPMEGKRELGKTKEEIKMLIKQQPESKDFLMRYAYMVDDDCFDYPVGYVKQEIIDPCLYFNHSCDGNCGFASDGCDYVVAKRDIDTGEELTYDYQIMDSELSFHSGLNCKCGSHRCRGVLKFDDYRCVDWQNENYEYSGEHIKQRIDELKTKWYSSSCFVKKYNNKTERGLTALKKISKNELVGKFSDVKNIKAEEHFFRQSSDPMCFVDTNGKVYAKENIEPSTELTLDFNAKL